MQLNDILNFLPPWQGGKKVPHSPQCFPGMMLGQKDPEYLLKNGKNSSEKQRNEPVWVYSLSKEAT